MKRLFCWLALPMLIGCSGNDSVPSSIIKKDSMETILWDIIQADQFSLQYLAKDSARINVKLETAKLYQRVFDLHKVSHEDFQKSFKYYMNRPDISKLMLDSLSARASRLRIEAYKHGSTPLAK